MSQNDVVGALKKERELGNDNYFTVAQIEEMVRNKGGSFLGVRKDISTLVRFGVLEVERRGLVSRRYRLREIDL